MESQSCTTSDTLEKIAKEAYFIGVHNKNEPCPFTIGELAEYWRDGVEGKPFKFLEFKQEHWTTSGF